MSRMKILSQVPTFAESGVPGIGLSWLAIMAPKGTLARGGHGNEPGDHPRAGHAGLCEPHGPGAGRDTSGGPPEVLAERIRVELPRWKTVIDRAGIRPE